MKTAFLTETHFRGKWPLDFPNSRTEICWMLALDADHYNIYDYASVQGYDRVFIIFPKGIPRLNAVGCEMIMPSGMQDKDTAIYSMPIVETLKKHNGKVCYIQEGPCWFINDMDLDVQFMWYNQLSQCDVLYAHNTTDVPFFKGMFPGKQVVVIPTLMYDHLIKDIVVTTKQNKVMIGGNMANWYGGFQSYMVASVFNMPIYVPSSHCKRPGEEQVPNLHHLPWANWVEWMRTLSTFRYAVHLMPTAAAGTFSMNCAYWCVPCIGNEKVDTQRELFPELSVDVNDVEKAMYLAEKMCTNPEWGDRIGKEARNRLEDSRFMNVNKWQECII